MERKPLVYIAGPISIGNQFVNVGAALEAWDLLANSGIHAICPHWSALQEMYRGKPYYFWIEHSKQLVRRCDAVFRIPGESRGADIECDLARSLGKPVFDKLSKLLLWHRGVCDGGCQVVGCAGGTVGLNLSHRSPESGEHVP